MTNVGTFVLTKFICFDSIFYYNIIVLFKLFFFNLKILTESWELSENTTPVQDEINSAVAQVLTSYTYDNSFQSNITDSHHSLHTPHYFPDNFEIPMLNHTYLNTSAPPSQVTDLVNHTSPSTKFPKVKYYKKNAPFLQNFETNHKHLLLRLLLLLFSKYLIQN